MKVAKVLIAVTVTATVLIVVNPFSNKGKLTKPAPAGQVPQAKLLQLEMSPEFARLAKTCKENVPCKDEEQIKFVRAIATLGDAAAAYKLAGNNCQFGEMRDVIVLKTELLVPKAWAQTRSFDERLRLLPMAEHSSYLSDICWSLADEARTPKEFLTLWGKTGEPCDDPVWTYDEPYRRYHPWREYVMARFARFGVEGIRSFTSLVEVAEFASILARSERIDTCAGEEVVGKFRALAPQTFGYDSLIALEDTWYSFRRVAADYLSYKDSVWICAEVDKYFAARGLELMREAAEGGELARMALGTELEQAVRAKWSQLAQAEIEKAASTHDLSALRKLRDSDKLPWEKKHELNTRIATLYGVVPAGR